jgi:hypothetical protein
LQHIHWNVSQTCPPTQSFCSILDNDHVTADLKRHLESEVGHERAQRYRRSSKSLVPSWATPTIWVLLQRYQIEYPRYLRLLAVFYFLIRYPFANRLFPGPSMLCSMSRNGGPDDDSLRR